MLTRTLRDGLVIRTDFNGNAPGVEYERSEPGAEVFVRTVPIWAWIAEDADGFRRSREAVEEGRTGLDLGMPQAPECANPVGAAPNRSGLPGPPRRIPERFGDRVRRKALLLQNGVHAELPDREATVR